MKRRSLRSIFVLSAILVILVTGGAVGYISYVNSSAVVRVVTRDRFRELSVRVVEHLQAFLSGPEILLEQNARLLTQGTVSAADQGALQAMFLQQAAVPSSITDLYFGNTRGGLAGAGHDGRQRSFFVVGTEGFVAGPFHKMQISLDGRSSNEEIILPGYDARLRPWYQAALAHDGAAWGAIYALFSDDDLTLSPSRLVRAADGRLLGVMGADISLSNIARFLNTLHDNLPGLTYIMESSGLLVATSIGERPFLVDADGYPSERLSATASSRPEIAVSARAIQDGTLDFLQPAALNASRHGQLVPSVGVMKVNGVRHVIAVTPFTDPQGLSWRIVTLVPTGALNAPTMTANLRTVALIVLAVVLVAIVAALVIQRVLQPLEEIAASAKAVGRGDLSRVLPADRGDEVGALARAFNDMMGRLRTAQDQQRRQLAKLAFAENRYRNLFQNAEVAICNEDYSDLMAALARLRAAGVADIREHLRGSPEELVALAGLIKVVECNSATYRLFGLVPGEETPEPIDRYLALDGADVFMKELGAIWAGAAEFRGEVHIKTKAGEDRTILLSRPIPKAPEDYRIVPVSLVDLTERKQAEEALWQKNNELQRSNAELESFAHVAAHDLREPLRTLASYVTLLRMRMGSRLNKEEADFLGYIHEGALRMDALVCDLLEFACVGRSEKPMAPVPLGSVVQKALADLRGRMDLTGADIVVPAVLPTVFGDAVDLVRVFTNLIGNAVKYRNPNEPLRVIVGAAPMPPASMAMMGSVERSTWRIFVRDNGIGLAPGQGYEQRIFRLFQRLHARDAHGGGTGIGLAICKKVVEHHGGRIWAESPGENQGCTIHFTLPAVRTAIAGPA